VFVTDALEVKSKERLRDLSEVLSAHETWRGKWPRDVLVIVDDLRDVIGRLAGVGGEGEITYSQLEQLPASRLRVIWGIIPCPWCGDSNDHLAACPMSAFASPSEQRHALQVWEIAYRSARLQADDQPIDSAELAYTEGLAQWRATLARPL
jgi:hypothetical protein